MRAALSTPSHPKLPTLVPALISWRYDKQRNVRAHSRENRGHVRQQSDPLPASEPTTSVRHPGRRGVSELRIHVAAPQRGDRGRRARITAQGATLDDRVARLL